MVNIFKEFFHLRNYWFMVPLVGMVPWLGMLIALLSAWSLQGHPLYWFATAGQHPPYISYIGATNLQPLFISCAGWQGIMYVSTLLIEYNLRRTGKLQYWFKKDERNLLWAATVLAVIGELGILFVSIFSIKNYDHVHHAMLGVFLAFVTLSGICLICQYLLMGLHYRKIHVSHKYWNKFTISFYLKVFFFVAAIIFAICFGAVSDDSVSSAFEWTLAYWYVVIFLIFAYDLFPAAKRHHKNAPYIKDWEKYDYYMYNKHYGAPNNNDNDNDGVQGTHPYAKYAGAGYNEDYRQSNENADTLVHQNSDFSDQNLNNQNYRETNRDFNDDELAQYPMRNQENNQPKDQYPIPHGQQIPVYNQVEDDDENSILPPQNNSTNQENITEAYNNGTKDDKKNCIIV